MASLPPRASSWMIWSRSGGSLRMPALSGGSKGRGPRLARRELDPGGILGEPGSSLNQARSESNLRSLPLPPRALPPDHTVRRV